MELDTAAVALDALSHKGRLMIYRSLVQVGDRGIAAGDLARQLAVPANSLSTNLAVLNRAGLVVAQREGRSVIYSARFDVMRSLVTYLVEDCCQGRPEVCGVDGLARTCS